MGKKSIITLTEAERAELQSLVKKRSAKSAVVKRSLALLAADTDGAGMSDAAIAAHYHRGRRTVERLRQRWVEEGHAVALHGTPLQTRPPRKFDGGVEAHLVALRCAAPPEGSAHWTLHLLADQMVTLGYVASMSHESVRQILKKTRSSPGASGPG